MTTTKRINYKQIGMIACAVVVVIMIIAAVAIFGSDSNPERVLKKYLNASDYRTTMKYMAFDLDTVYKEICASNGIPEKEFSNWLYNEMGARSVKELYELEAAKYLEYLEDRVGNNVKFSYNINDSHYFNSRDRARQIDQLKGMFRQVRVDASNFIPFDKISEMMEFEIEITVSGSDEEMTVIGKVIMVKIGRNWRVLDDSDVSDKLYGNALFY